MEAPSRLVTRGFFMSIDVGVTSGSLTPLIVPVDMQLPVQLLLMTLKSITFSSYHFFPLHASHRYPHTEIPSFQYRYQGSNASILQKVEVCVQHISADVRSLHGTDTCL